MSIVHTDNIDLLTLTTPADLSAGVTVDTTGTKFDVSLRDQIVIQFRCANHVSGNGVFTVDGSNDGTNWTTGLALQDLTSTTPTTYVTSKTLNSNSTAGVKVPAGWRFIRAVVDLTTDGTYYAYLQAGG